MIVSTNVGKTTYAPNIVPKVMGKQCVFVLIGYIAMLFMNRAFRFSWFSKLEIGFIPLCLFILALPFAFPEVGGSHAWIQIAGMSLQPSEFVKPFMIILCATCLYRAKKKNVYVKGKGQAFQKSLDCVYLYMYNNCFPKDYGTLTIITFIFLSCIMIPKYPVLLRTQRILKLIVTAGIVFAVVLFGVTNIGTEVLKHTPLAHIAVRIENFKDPYTNVYGDGYQPANSLYGIASAML